MSTSSKTSTPPTDASRPLAPLAPSSTNNTLNAQALPLPTHSILTGKEWIIPPRPKPGRKPAVDTPPTKRKAQNRAAQRAFRERRAAKVGELEEQMKAMEEEDQREQEELRGQIRELENNVESYNRMLIMWGEKMKEMESQLREERRMREEIQQDLERLKGGYDDVSTDAVPLRSRAASRKQTEANIPSTVLYPPSLDSEDMSDIPLGCGRCTQTTRCQCIEEALSLNPTIDNSPKRPHSPSDPRAAKHYRQEPPRSELKADSSDLEIDFTTHKPPKLRSQPSRPQLTSQITPIDPCGFCADGTACLCAEIAAENAKGRHDTHGHASLASQTSSDSINGVKLPANPPLSTYPMNFTFSRASSKNNGIGAAIPSPCAKGPGTCAQCLFDPNSTLFCKSLASTRTTQSQLQNSNSPKLSISLPTLNAPAISTTNISSSTQSNPRPPSITLTCAEAFTTLSRHPAFDRASFELGTWLPQLATVPKGLEGKTAFEIEAASVLGVLKFFDKKYGETKASTTNGDRGREGR